MMNYVKSELYRLTHSKGFYCFTLILAGLSFLYNAVLGWLRIIDYTLPSYVTTSFSYSLIVSSPMIFCVMGVVIGFILYEENRRNGNLKNTIAFGISRTKVFAGECIVTTIAAVISMIVILAVYIISAVVFLDHTGPVSLMDLLTEVPAVFLVAVASLISGIVCIEAFEKNSIGIIIWLVTWMIIPKAFFYVGIGLDNEVVYDIAMWMPVNYFGTAGMIVNTSQCFTAWETVESMAKCVITGIIGTGVFSIMGTALLKEREL